MPAENKRSSPMEQGEASSKRARDVVKQEPEAGEVIEDAEGGGALVAAEDMTSEVPQIEARVEISVLHCLQCHLPFKPPVYKCEAGHVVCCRCHGPHRQVCSNSANYTRCRELDAVVGAVKVPCRYEVFGCKRYVVYHEAEDHHLACACAPCSCPEPGCGFSGSPAMLLGHFGAAHSWPVAEFRYMRPRKISLLPLRRWHVLVEEEDRRVFLLSMDALGAATAVSVVCVRANAAAAAPQFKCKLWAEEASANTGDLALATATVQSSDLSGGFVASEQGMFLAIPPLLHKESVAVSFRITKHAN